MKINVKSKLLSGVVTGVIIMIVGGGLVPIIGNQVAYGFMQLGLSIIGTALIILNFTKKRLNRKNLFNYRNLATTIFILYFFAPCNSQEIIYLDGNFPDMVPKIYAPNMLSLPDRYEHGFTIRNNGSEHIFGLDGRKTWAYNGLACLKRGKNNTLVFDTLKFTSNIPRKNNAIISGEPNFSSGNQAMYFVADYPTDILKVTISKNGKWENPVKLDSAVNSIGSEWYPIVAPDNCLYFSREGVIHKAELINGEYRKVSKLEATFNYDCGDQVFSKNMDYIIFASPRQGGYGNNDLYIAFKKDNGEWMDGINMGPEINTKGFELAPYISPDNKYLFFTRRDKYNDASASDIYWVSLDIVSKIKGSENQYWQNNQYK
jgi:hypothetical protein